MQYVLQSLFNWLLRFILFHLSIKKDQWIIAPLFKFYKMPYGYNIDPEIVKRDI